jgi:23S rRNA (adenine2503-C2)-methyltransferase
MLEGVNDSIKDAKQLIKLISPLKSKVNLIPFNPWPDSTYNVSSPEKINNFKKFILENGKIIATIRMPRGDDILAACGQLKSLNEK